MKKLSRQEFFIGFLSTVLLFNLPISIISGILWMLGGTYWKGIRRYGIPFVVALFGAIVGLSELEYLYVAISSCIILHIGDSFPDHRTTTADEGSWLGKQVEKIIPDMNIGGPITKLLIVFIFQISLIPILT